jgi:predicted MFS family arabinose efflux permease
MLVAPGSKLIFTFAALILSATYFFAQAYLIALAAELDRKGRIVAAAGGFISGGSAIGPALGGYLIDDFGYVGTSWASLAMIVATVILARIALGGRSQLEDREALPLRPFPAS